RTNRCGTLPRPPLPLPLLAIFLREPAMKRPMCSFLRSSSPDLCALAVALAVPIALWAILFVAVPPGQQNFPLNDHWSYARSALAFARGEGIHYNRWSWMPQLGLWFWACPFIWTLGESHAMLRGSVMLLGLIGGVAFYDLLRQEGHLSPRRAAFVTATLLV